MTRHTPEDLAKKIKDARNRQDRERPAASPLGSPAAGGTAKAMRAATDLVAALAVGGGLGYAIDHWLGTKPWGMIILLFLGFIAGFLNIYRAETGQDFKIGFKHEDKK